MQIAITGATGFLGRYFVQRLASHNRCRCWYRSTSDRGGLEDLPVEWVEGELGQPESFPLSSVAAKRSFTRHSTFPAGWRATAAISARLRGETSRARSN